MSHDREDPVIDKLQVDQAEHIKDGDELRNINSFEYLKNIAAIIPDAVDVYPLNFIREFFKTSPDYLPDYPYGDMYSQFLLDFEDAMPKLDKVREIIERDINLKVATIGTHTENLQSGQAGQFEKLFRDSIRQLNEDIVKLKALSKALDTVVDTIYANPNHALERSAKMVETVIDQGVSHTSSDIENVVRDRMKGKGKTKMEKFKDKVNYVISYRDINKTTPQQEGSNTGRLKGMVSSTFKPQTTTSMASIRTYDYKDGQELPTEYRFGTQGQYQNKIARVSPMFESWLQVQQRKRDSNPLPEDSEKTRITHIYFNNLGLDRTGYEGNRERGLTQELHGLESRHRNVAVITLPADKGLMDKHVLDDHSQSIDVDVAFNRMLNIATGKATRPDPDPVKDFYISDDVKLLLYGGSEEDGYDKENETEVINGLLTMTMEKLGFDTKETLSPAEMQAVYFHFIKYELTNFIIDKLKPESFNMSCKDAIDRGGVSSAYYNLMKSLESGSPLSKDEFYRALHAAPTLVKGRGMNHHTRLIWNAVDAYLNSSQPKPMDPPDWLVEWRNNNAPTTSRLTIVGKLESYLTERAQDERSRHGKIGGYDKTTKVDAATKLLALIKDPKRDDIEFTKKEWDALNQGRLSKVCEEIKKHGVLDLDQYKPVEKALRV